MHVYIHVKKERNMCSSCCVMRLVPVWLGPSELQHSVLFFFLAELCDDPPTIKHATFRAITYKNGTMLNCECEKGFRRIKYGSSYMLCTGNSSHSFWDNKCECVNSCKSFFLSLPGKRELQ